MGVTAEMLRPFLEGWTVKQIVDAKRLFIVDHKILEDLPTRNDRPVRSGFIKSKICFCMECHCLCINSYSIILVDLCTNRIIFSKW